MSGGGSAPRRNAPKVGIFGFLGSGNLGNDAAFEVVLRYLRECHPEAEIDAMCMGPERLKSYYDVDAIPLLWYKQHEEKASRLTAVALKVVGKGVAAAHIACWVRRHDVVIVPGAGALESTLPLRALGFPYAMFLLCTSGRLFRTKVALVSVGANRMNQRLTRTLYNFAARMAFYRSYRDQQSLEAMRNRGVDVSQDRVYPDLVFGQPQRPETPTDPQTVGVGIMAYYGGNDDRNRANEIYANYVDSMKSFVRWLLDGGHRVRLYWGDNNDNVDETVVEEILADVRTDRPDLDPGDIVADTSSSPSELMDAIAPVGLFVGTRYHNVVSALRLCKPTMAIGYSAKFDNLMADMGLGEFCQSAASVDVDRLINQFEELERRSPEIRADLLDRNELLTKELEEQFNRLSALLFPWSPDRRRALADVATAT